MSPQGPRTEAGRALLTWLPAEERGWMRERVERDIEAIEQEAAVAERERLLTALQGTAMPEDVYRRIENVFAYHAALADEPTP